jgi:hypothetical protein
MNNAILSEHEGEKNSKKLGEMVLWKRIAWVETNLKNELRPNFAEVFTRLIDKKALGFKLPKATMRPFALHLVDGNMLLFWASENSFPFWVDALRSVQIPHLLDQKILLSYVPTTCFAMSVFHSLLPIETTERPKKT